METSASDRTTNFFRYLLLSGAILFVVIYLVLAFLRIRYPFELEWMEGGMVDHVTRILSGQKLYVAPSLEFVPFIYTPLYFYLSAALSAIIGVGFLPLRLISFISSLGCFFMIFLMVKRETGSSYWGLLASSLFVATFRISGAWLDIARADSLFLLFLLVALYLIRFKESAMSYVFAGVLVCLSFLTKQIGLLISLPIMAYCVLSDRRRSVYFIGTVVVIIGASTYLLNWLHDGWYSFYVFQVPSQHSVILKSMLVKFWTEDIISPLSIAALMSIFYIFAHRLNSNKKNRPFYLLMLLAMLGGAWISRLHMGGYDNVLLPAYAALSIMFGLGTHAVFQLIQGASENRRKFTEIFIYLVCTIQFLGLVYDPRAQVPSKEDLEAGRFFITTMTQQPGDILVPYHGYLPGVAGKRNYAHDAAITDVVRAKDCPARTKLLHQINQAIAGKRFGAIILDTDWFRESMESHYVKQRQIFDDPNVFWTVTGLRTRPNLIYVPKESETE